MGATISRNPSTVYNAREGQKFVADTTLVVVTCATCGVTYAIPERFEKSALKWRGDRSNGWKICCPFGHTWWYVGETDQERLKRERDEARLQRDATRYLLDHEQRSHIATRGHLTRKRKQLDRVAAGVCPCCKRSFKNLARHMAGQHPEFSG
jgi:hypothetical protein